MSKWKVKLILKAPETVRWHDLTDPESPYFTTDLKNTTCNGKLAADWHVLEVPRRRDQSMFDP